MQALSTLLNWATTFKRNGRPLLSHNPVKSVSQPVVLNPAQPIASRERYERLLRVANAVEDTGRFRLLLQLAWATGHRINAIRNLRRSDILLSREDMVRGLAESGMDESRADEWLAAIRWRAEYDKKGVQTVTPLGPKTTAALQAYLQDNPIIAEGPLFPADRAEGVVSIGVTGEWLERAEESAKLQPQRRGGWHTFRRSFANRNKHQPLQDVMAQGGWHDFAALQKVYQKADPQTMSRLAQSSE